MQGQSPCLAFSSAEAAAHEDPPDQSSDLSTIRMSHSQDLGILSSREGPWPLPVPVLRPQESSSGSNGLLTPVSSLCCSDNMPERIHLGKRSSRCDSWFQGLVCGGQEADRKEGNGDKIHISRAHPSPSKYSKSPIVPIPSHSATIPPMASSPPEFKALMIQ